MNGPRNLHVPRDNWILAALPLPERERLDPLLETINLKIRQSLFEPEVPIEHVYFPVDAMASIVTRPLEGGTVLEVATVGNEGFVGVPLLLGAASSAMRGVCQIAGQMKRMRAEPFRRVAASLVRFHELLNLYTLTLFNQIGHSGACNRIHGLEERACRWLLMVHDRTGMLRFALPPEFFGQMLGVRRAVVNLAAAQLVNAGFISYDEDHVTIHNRRGLEMSSCECYAFHRRELDRLLPP